MRSWSQVQASMKGLMKRRKVSFRHLELMEQRAEFGVFTAAALGDRRACSSPCRGGSPAPLRNRRTRRCFVLRVCLEEVADGGAIRIAAGQGSEVIVAQFAGAILTQELMMSAVFSRSPVSFGVRPLREDRLERDAPAVP